jgi:hypothetical protein
MLQHRIRLRLMPQWWGLIVIGITCAYFLFAVRPAYESRLYRLSDTEIEQGQFDLPAGMVDSTSGQENWRLSAAVSSILAMECLAIPLAMLLAFSVMSRRYLWGRGQRLFWLFVSITSLATLFLTIQSTRAFVAWVLD